MVHRTSWPMRLKIRCSTLMNKSLKNLDTSGIRKTLQTARTIFLGGIEQRIPHPAALQLISWGGGAWACAHCPAWHTQHRPKTPMSMLQTSLITSWKHLSVSTPPKTSRCRNRPSRPWFRPWASSLPNSRTARPRRCHTTMTTIQSDLKTTAETVQFTAIEV